MKLVRYFIPVLLVYLLITSCSKDSSSGDYQRAATGGKGGSLARFTIAGNYLYTVDDENLKLFNISKPAEPVYENNVRINIGIETIFRRQNTLFIGSQTGMYVYDISDPALPQYLSQHWHMTSCDPVVVDDKYAYITLNTINEWCGRYTNELHIVDITDLNSPQFISVYPMTGPKGLGIDNHLLFVCDDGLKVYDATDVLNLELINHFNIEANDVIPHNGILMVIGNDGLYQYDYTGKEMVLLSKLAIGEQTGSVKSKAQRYFRNYAKLF